MKRILLIAPVLILVGCTAPNRFEKMVYTPSALQEAQKISPFYKNISIEEVKDGLEEAFLRRSLVSGEELKKALSQSLEKAHYLALDPNSRYSLSAYILDIDLPFQLFNTDVKITVFYILKNKTTNDFIFREKLVSDFRVTFGQETDGTMRIEKACMGAMKANIGAFIQRLSFGE